MKKISKFLTLILIISFSVSVNSFSTSRNSFTYDMWFLNQNVEPAFNRCHYEKRKYGNSATPSYFYYFIHERARSISDQDLLLVKGGTMPYLQTSDGSKIELFRFYRADKKSERISSAPTGYICVSYEYYSLFRKSINKLKKIAQKNTSTINFTEKKNIENEKKKIAEEKKKIEEEKRKISENKEKINKEIKNQELYPAGSGSGFFVSNDGHIISNHHVIDGCGATKISFNGDLIEAKILASDKINDIAILKTNIDPKRIFPVSDEDVSLLEDVIVAGYPLGKELSSSIKTHKGVVTSLSGIDDNFSEFQTDATINQGNSGGPVVNQKGNVVGIAVKLLPPSAGQNIFFAIKSSTLNQFAKPNNLKFLQPNNNDLTNKELGALITDATVFIECWMTLKKIKEEIEKENNRKAFYERYR